MFDGNGVNYDPGFHPGEPHSFFAHALDKLIDDAILVALRSENQYFFCSLQSSAPTIPNNSISPLPTFSFAFQ
jgi:hypothetical protein